MEDTAHPTTVQTTMKRESLVEKFSKVFTEDIGQLDGEYHIKIDPTIIPVQHAPCRVPVALRAQLKAELEEMEQQAIIVSVTTPTAWVSSMVVVPKKNGKLRICLDPKDLNWAIQREHYPLPTIEDVATRLHGAKVFTKLDAKNERVLACEIRRGIVIPHHIQHPIWPVPLEENAVWYPICSGSVPAKDARADRRDAECRSNS